MLHYYQAGLYIGLRMKLLETIVLSNAENYSRLWISVSSPMVSRFWCVSKLAGIAVDQTTCDQATSLQGRIQEFTHRGAQ